MFTQIRVEEKTKEWTQMKTIWKMEKNLSRVTRNKLWMMTVLKKLSKKRKEDEKRNDDLIKALKSFY